MRVFPIQSVGYTYGNGAAGGKNNAFQIVNLLCNTLRINDDNLRKVDRKVKELFKLGTPGYGLQRALCFLSHP